jgi:hypothetical protein
MKSRKLAVLILGLSGALLSLLAPGNPSRNVRRNPDAQNKLLPSRHGVFPARAVPVISATLGQHDPDYLVQPAGRALRAENARQGISARFTQDGVTIESAGSRLRASLSGYGYGEEWKRASPAAPRAAGNRVEYRRGVLKEWYANGPMGLEQGFTLAAPPEKYAGEPLQIALTLSGDLTASAAEDGKSVSFASRDGKPLLRYAGLLAQDATGRELPARMELRGDRLILAVRDTGASYPIVVDPTYTQAAILTDPMGMANDQLGGGVSLDDSGKTAVANSFAGAAVVFVKQASGVWQFATKLTGSSGAASTAISGDGSTIVVGNCSDAVCIGAAFVYTIPSGGWNSVPTVSPTAMLSPSDPLAGQRFGISVAIDHAGDTIAVGSPCELTNNHPGSPICGEVHVYVKPTTGWANTSTETAILSEFFPLATNMSQCPQTSPMGFYAAEVRTLGSSVSMDSAGATIAAGAPEIFSGCTTFAPGAAYVYLKPTSGWATTTMADATLTASNGLPQDELGISVSISSDATTVVAGAFQHPFSATTFSGPGAAYVFVKPATGWASEMQQAQLAVSGAQNNDRFGGSASVSSNGSTVVVGAPDHPTSGTTSGPGATLVYFEPSGGWATATSPKTEDQALTTANCTPTTPCTDINGHTVTPASLGFGASCVLSSDASTIASGDPQAQVGSNMNQGAVFVYHLPPCTTPTITPPLSPSSKAAGSGGFTLTVNGTNFASGAVVSFNGTAEATMVVSATQVTATINAADIATPGTVTVTVSNPGGCVSAPATFTVTGALPSITSVSPPSDASCGTGFTLTVTGSNFVSGDVVDFNGKAETTTFVDAMHLTAAIPAAALATAGVVNVMVTDPAGNMSNSVQFTINNPAPVVTGFSPTHVSAGDGFPFTVNGTCFVATSVVTFNGNNETTTFVSSTQLNVTVATKDVSKGGNETVAVTSPPPGGGTSTAAATFTLDDFMTSGPGGGVTVKRGDKVTITITITPTANGFTNPIMFSVSGLPAKTTGTFNPPSLTPGMTPMTTTLTITTTKPSGVPPRGPWKTPSNPRVVLLMIEAAALLVSLLAFQAIRRWPGKPSGAAYVSLALVIVAAAAMAACAPSGGTPTGTSTLMITATAGSDMQTTNVMLTIQ